MPPKGSRSKTTTDDEMEEIRKSLDFMSAELSNVTKQLGQITELVSEVKQLKNIIKERDKTIELLEKRVDDLEQYSRIDDVIITGLDVKPRSYARAVAGGGHVSEDAKIEDQLTLEMQVLQFLESKEIFADANTISACHTLPRKGKSGRAASNDQTCYHSSFCEPKTQGQPNEAVEEAKWYKCIPK